MLCMTKKNSDEFAVWLWRCIVRLDYRRSLGDIHWRRGDGRKNKDAGDGVRGERHQWKTKTRKKGLKKSKTKKTHGFCKRPELKTVEVKDMKYVSKKLRTKAMDSIRPKTRVKDKWSDWKKQLGQDKAESGWRTMPKTWREERKICQRRNYKLFNSEWQSMVHPYGHFSNLDVCHYIDSSFDWGGWGVNTKVEEGEGERGGSW